MRINWRDFAERVGWTALQAAAGAGLAALATDGIGWEEALTFVGVTTLVAVCKVIIAQRAGSDDSGAALPGGVPIHESG
jgi:hypothetical protein